MTGNRRGASCLTCVRASSSTPLFLMCFLALLALEREFFFTGDPVHLCRIVYKANPFPEMQQISKFIQDHSQLEDRVAVIASEPEIYFESNRLSATGYIYMYPLMEAQPFASRMQREMIAEVEAAQPKYLVYVENASSWDRGPKSDQTIFQWLDRFVGNGYRLVTANGELRRGEDYRWEDWKEYSPQGESRILVYGRDGR